MIRFLYKLSDDTEKAKFREAEGEDLASIVAELENQGVNLSFISEIDLRDTGVLDIKALEKLTALKKLNLLGTGV